MELSIERKIEIEREFAKALSSGKTRKQALANVIVETVDLSEEPIYGYILEAYQMPIEEISKEIKRYDSSYPRLDKLKFVNDLCKRYNVDRRTIVQRIQNVRRINRYLKENINEFKIESKERVLGYSTKIDAGKRK